MKKKREQIREQHAMLEAAAQRMGLVTDQMLKRAAKKKRGGSLLIAGALAAFLMGCAAPKPRQETTPPAAECCRYCTNSKACGNGCIPYENQCHQPPGCACTVGVRAP